MSAKSGIPDRSELLLSAIFAPETQAEEAWSRWRSGFDLDAQLPNEEFLLLPAACDARRARIAVDPLKGRFQGIIRRSWSWTQIQRRAILPALEALSPVGVVPMIPELQAFVLGLRGAPEVPDREPSTKHESASDCFELPASHAALQPAPLPAGGIIPFEGADVYIDASRFLTSVEVLLRQDWISPRLPSGRFSARALSRMLDARFSWPLRHPSGTWLRLQWRLGPEGFLPGMSAIAQQQAAVSTGIPGTESRCLLLGPAGSILHTLLCRPAGLPVPDSVALARLAFLLRADPGLLSDTECAAQAERYGATLPLLWSLDYLESRLGIPVPGTLLPRLSAMPVPEGLRSYWSAARNRRLDRDSGSAPLHAASGRDVRSLRARIGLLWKDRRLSVTTQAPDALNVRILPALQVAAEFPGFLATLSVRAPKRPDTRIK